MHAAERPTLAEIIEILADGLSGDLEPAREIVDRHAAQRVRQFHYFGLPQRECHLSEKYRHTEGLETANAGF
jgi:elongation factor P hydroxylase